MFLRHRRCRPRVNGQKDTKDAAFAEFAFDLDAAPMCAHQHVGDIEPQPQAILTAIVLGARAAFEKVGQLLVGNADAVVGDCDRDEPVDAA